MLTISLSYSIIIIIFLLHAFLLISASPLPVGRQIREIILISFISDYALSLYSLHIAIVFIKSVLGLKLFIIGRANRRRPNLLGMSTVEWVQVVVLIVWWHLIYSVVIFINLVNLVYRVNWDIIWICLYLRVACPNLYLSIVNRLSHIGNYLADMDAWYPVVSPVIV